MKMLKKECDKNTRDLVEVTTSSIHLSSLNTHKNSLLQLKNTHFLYTLARTCMQCSSLKSQIDSIKNGD